MSARRMLEWVILFATAGLMMLLKWLHLGVTHYNLFLSILLGWCLFTIFAFCSLAGAGRSGPKKVL
jgi:hypothetical protein